MRSRPSALPFIFGLLCACSTIVGADFDDKTEGPGSGGGSGNGSSGANNGNGGSARGGSSSGGEGTAKGGAASGGSSGAGASSSGGADRGGGSNGGTTGGGGTSTSGGNAPRGGNAGTGGILTSGGRASGGSTGNQGGAGAGGEGAGGDGGSGAGGVDGGAGGFAGDGGFGGLGGAGGTGGGLPAVVVLNEIRGKGGGEEYIELVNRGPGVAQIGGWSLADSEHLYVFPSGTTLSPQTYLLILLNKDMERVTTCSTPNPCFHLTWGVSKSGETVTLSSATAEIVDTTYYPPSVTGAQSWSRVPDGVGPFKAATPTQEAPNPG